MKRAAQRLDISSPVYVLDANVFMEAARRYYAFDLAPGFWQGLQQHAIAGRIKSIDRVKQELDRGNDDLADWADDEFKDAFASTNRQDVIDVYARVMDWAAGKSQYTDAAKHKFASGADGWLVAFANANRCVVVTHELPAPYAKNIVKLPEVCDAFGVGYVDTFAMLRALRVILN